MLWLAKENMFAAEWNKAKPKRWELFITWLKRNAFPTLNQTNGVRAYKSPEENMKLMDRYDSNFTPENQDRWSVHTKWLCEGLEKLQDGMLNELITNNRQSW